VAPELLSYGGVSSISADLFSLGVIGLELLKGTHNKGDVSILEPPRLAFTGNGFKLVEEDAVQKRKREGLENLLFWLSTASLEERCPSAQVALQACQRLLFEVDLEAREEKSLAGSMLLDAAMSRAIFGGLDSAEIKRRKGAKEERKRVMAERMPVAGIENADREFNAERVPADIQCHVEGEQEAKTLDLIHQIERKTKAATAGREKLRHKFRQAETLLPRTPDDKVPPGPAFPF